MVRLIALLAAILTAGLGSRAMAGERQSICRTPSVVDVMARELHRRDYYARIEPLLVDEVPDVTANTVWCGVSVWTLSYDARRAVGVPIGRCEQHAFRVQALSHGFVVSYVR